MLGSESRLELNQRSCKVLAQAGPIANAPYLVTISDRTDRASYQNENTTLKGSSLEASRTFTFGTWWSMVVKHRRILAESSPWSPREITANGVAAVPSVPSNMRASAMCYSTANRRTPAKFALRKHKQSSSNEASAMLATYLCRDCQCFPSNCRCLILMLASAPFCLYCSQDLWAWERLNAL